MITPSAAFIDNLAQMPAIDHLARAELCVSGEVIATIENAPGKQGSLKVYTYLHETFGTIDAKAAAHGLDVFGEHTADAKARPGAHPNIDHLLTIMAGGEALSVTLVPA
ncbi:MAG: DUF2322 family protein [Maritimibacter sp.]